MTIAPLGMHFSIEGGIDRAIDRAIDLGCNCLQIFASNPRGWAFNGVDAEQAEKFKAKRRLEKISAVAVHVPYLVNISSDSDEVFDKSIVRLKAELKAADAIEADFLVTHLGSPRSEGAQFAIKRVMQALTGVYLKDLRTTILLENTSGSGTGFGSDMAMIGSIVKDAGKKGIKVGICVDTCHAYAAGYDLCASKGIERLLKELKTTCKTSSLKMIHLNDSKGALGSRLDRHEFLGKGSIGEAGLAAFLRTAAIRRLPVILETPKVRPDDDTGNLAVARRLMRAPSNKS